MRRPRLRVLSVARAVKRCFVSFTSHQIATMSEPAIRAVSTSNQTPNPSIERTRSGSAGLALISFWAKPAPPPRAAHVKRCTSVAARTARRAAIAAARRLAAAVVAPTVIARARRGRLVTRAWCWRVPTAACATAAVVATAAAAERLERGASATLVIGVAVQQRAQQHRVHQGAAGVWCGRRARRHSRRCV